jgi:hypothetical protein
MNEIPTWEVPYFPTHAKLDPSLHSVGDWVHLLHAWSHLQKKFPLSQTIAIVRE